MILNDDDFFGAAIESAGAQIEKANGNVGPIASPNEPRATPSQRSGKFPLYLDLETVPDESRMHLYDLPLIPEVPPERSPDDCPPVADLLGKSIDEIEKTLLHLNPRHDYLNSLADEEGKKPKPRAGVKSAIQAVFKARDTASRAVEKQLKDMATCPEMCQIVAAGWAIGPGDPQSVVVGERDDRNERDILETIWEMIRELSPIVVWNGLAFDLPVILARSALLGVQPTRSLNLSPWSNREIEDLQVIRFGKSPVAGGSLKRTAKLYEIDVPAGDTNGADVERLWRNGEHEMLGKYVRSDVWVLRELRAKWAGYFCV